MKKLLIFTVTAAMLLSLAACAQSAKPAAKPDQPAQTETADSKNAQAETAETETVDVDGGSVTMKGENGLVKLAVWTNGDYSYALSVESGLSQNDMAALVANVQ